LFILGNQTLAIKGCNIQRKGKGMHCIPCSLLSVWLNGRGFDGLNLLHSEAERSSAHRIIARKSFDMPKQ
jgi:hypothetical protein